METGPPGRQPTTVLPATQTAPPGAAVVPAAQTAPLPLTELPRTGPSDVRLLLLAAGMAFVVGGGAQLFPRRKQAARR